jgi:RNA polymerase sigma factor (sigma-70 family)
MSAAAVRGVVRRLGPTADPPTDADLVAAFVARRDHAAFAELVRRHGPTVLGACRRVLSDTHAAEDAFQAVFLVLARKAGAVRPPGAVGGWLYGVAVRTANKAKVAAARRRRREMATAVASRLQANSDREGGGGLENAELRSVLDAELAKLPDAVRAAIVLCDLHGKTRAEAAAELGCPEGTVAARLHRGRKKLADALTRRGLALPAAGVAAVLAPASVSASLSQSTFALASGTASAAVRALAREVIRSMTTSIHAIALGAIALLTGGLLAAGLSGAREPAPPVADSPGAPVLAAEPAPTPPAQPDHGGPVYSVSYSPDGTRFLSVGVGKAVVWEAETRKKLFTLNAEFAAFSGDGKNLFVLDQDEFRTVDAATGKTLGRKPRQQPKPVLGGRTAAFSRGAMMWVEFDGVRHHLRTEITDDLYDLADQKAHNPLGSTIVPIHGRGGAFSPDGKLFAGIHAATKDYKEMACLTLGNPATGNRVGTISRGFNHPVHAFAWSPDGKEIAVGYADGVRVYESATLKENRKLDLKNATALAWSPDGKTLAAACETARKVNIRGGSPEPELLAVHFGVVLLDAQSSKEVRRFDGFADNLPVVSLAFRPDGKQLVCGAGFFPGDGPASNVPKPAKDAPGLRVLTLDAPEKPAAGAWRESKVLELTGWLGGSVAYSADGKALFVGGTDEHTRAYATETWKQLWEYKGQGRFAAVAVAPDDKTVAATFSGGEKRGVKLLDAATGKVGDTLEELGAIAEWPAPLAVAFFPDTRVLDMDRAVVTTRKVIFGNPREYLVKTWREWPKVSTIKSSTVAAGKKPADDYAVPLAVSPDGKRAVVTGPIDKDTGKNVLWAWAAGSGAGNQLLEGHKAAVTSAAWSRDGKLIVTGDADGVVITWDAATFKEKSRLLLAARVAAVAISADGKHVAAAVVRPVRGVPYSYSDETAYSEEVFSWQTANPPEKPKPISSHQAGAPFAGVASLAFAPDGKTLASAFCNFDHLTKLGDLVGTVRVFAFEAEKPKPAVVPKPVSAVEFSPDGKRYVVLQAGTAAVFDAKTRQKLYSAEAEAARFTADGKSLVAMGPKSINLHSSENGQITDSYNRPKTKWGWHSVVFSPDGKRLAAHFGTHAGVYDTATGKEVAELKERFEKAGYVFGSATGSDLAISPDGKTVAAVGVLLTADGQMGATVWDADTGKRFHVFQGLPDDGPRVAAFSPDSERLAIGFKDRVEVVPASPNVKFDPIVWRTDGPITALAYSADGKQLAIGLRAKSFDRWWADVREAYKGEVLVLDATSGERLHTLDKIARDSVLIEGKEIKEPTPEVLRGLSGFWVDPLVTALVFAPDGKKLLAGTGFPAIAPIPAGITKPGEAKLFELNAAAVPPAPAIEQKWTDAAILTDHESLVNAVAVAPDGKTFAAATERGVALWASATRKLFWKIDLPDAPAYALAFSGDSKFLYVAGKTELARLDAATGKQVKLYGDATGVGVDNSLRAIKGIRTRSLALSPDGKRLGGSDGYSAWMFEPEKPENYGTSSYAVTAPKDAKPVPVGLAWSAGGKSLAVITPKHTQRTFPSGITPDTHWPVRLWSVAAEESVRGLFGHDDPVTAVAWSKDGKVIASGDEKGIVILWDAASGKELWRHAFKGRDDTLGRINALAISPADNTVAVAVSLGSGKGPERVVLLDPMKGEDIGRVMRWSIPVASVAWSPDGKFLVTGCGAAGQAIKQTEPAVGEVVVWERKP